VANSLEITRSIQADAEKLLSERFGKKIVINSFTSIGGGCINHATKIETNVGPFFLKWTDFSLLPLAGNLFLIGFPFLTL